MMTIEPESILLLAAIGFLGSFVYGVTGFGAGLVTIPLASHFFAMPFVLAVFALLDIVNATRVLLTQPKAIVREEVTRLVPSSIAGVAIGVLLLLVLPAWLLMAALGVFVLGYALYSLLFERALPVIGIRWAYLSGLSGGICSAMFGAGGPPYAIYLSMRSHGKDQVRSTLAATSFVSIATRLVAFGFAGLLSTSVVWLTALAVMPAALIALWLADRTHAGMSRAALLRAIQVLLCLAGASLIVRALV